MKYIFVYMSSSTIRGIKSIEDTAKKKCCFFNTYFMTLYPFKYTFTKGKITLYIFTYCLGNNSKYKSQCKYIKIKLYTHLLSDQLLKLTFNLISYEVKGILLLTFVK